VSAPRQRVLVALQTWDVAHLTRLLEHRPDLIAAADLEAVAHKAVQWVSLREAVEGLPALPRTVLEAVSVLPSGATAEDVAGLWSPPADAAVVAEAVEELRARCLLDPGAPDLRLMDQVDRLLPHPLGLGRPTAACHAHTPFTELQRLCQAVDLPAPRSKQAARDTLQQALSSTDVLGAELRELPPELLDVLEQADREGPVRKALGADPFARLLPDDPTVADVVLLGLLAVVDVGRVELPAEVGLALRWPAAVRAPLVPPVPAGHQVADAQLASATAESLRTLLRLVDAVAEHLDARPVPLLSSGAVGVKELRALAHGTAEPAAVVTVLQLLDGAGLVAPSRKDLRLSTVWTTWASADDADRWHQLVLAWWDSVSTPAPRAKSSRPLRAWQHLQLDTRARQARRQLLRLLADSDQGRSYDEQGWLALWHAAHPEERLRADSERGHVPAPDLRADVLTEATHLGLLVDGAASSLARAVAAGEQVRPVLQGLSAAGQTRVHAQADMTLVCTGIPARTMRLALDRIATVEGSGAATVWRVSEQSLARAFDLGDGPGEVEQVLQTYAEDVPQSMAYLVKDAHRRHGRARVGAASSYVVVEDDALLGDALGRKGPAAKALVALGVRRVAPGVAVSKGTVSALVEALRGVGVSAVADGPAGAAAAVTRAKRATARPRSRPPLQRVDDSSEAAAAAARRLLSS